MNILLQRVKVAVVHHKNIPYPTTRSTTMAHWWKWLMVLTIAAFSTSVNGAPYILLKNKAPKCFQVEVPDFTELEIRYFTPDLVIVDEEPNGAIKEEKRKLEAGIDARYDERFQKRMESLKRAHLKDINISVTPRDSNGYIVPPNRKVDGDESSGKFPMKWREQVERREGMFTYDTGDIDGNLEICIQSYTASAETPSRIALSITEGDDKDDIESMLEEERQIQNERLLEENKLVKDETSKISAELVRMQRRAKSIAGDAQFSKSREEKFHGQSMSLNKAVRYWPMVRIFVLLVGGYLQVTHVVNYMKSRRIY